LHNASEGTTGASPSTRSSSPVALFIASQAWCILNFDDTNRCRVNQSAEVSTEPRAVQGNPPDAPMLAPAIGRIKKRLSKVPKAATADRGYGEAKVDAELHELGVQHVAIPRKGRPGAARRAVESSRRFRKLVKWRTGSEGRISYLKHSWGWERTMLDGIDGARTWCGWGVLAHNATKIAVLIDERESTRGLSPSSRPRPRTSTGPPQRPPPPLHRAPA